jgi:NAD(P)-dependent dehydrogenase (short-subunit alcohol dehydrogenase family)
MSSVSGIMSVPLLGAYSASKFALEAVADALRLELAGSGMHVALIEPANISTPIWAKGREQTSAWQERSPEAIARYERHIKAIERVSYAGERHGDPPEIVARAVAHALLAPRPRTRYLVARGAGMMPLLRLLPDRLRDWMVLRSFGL